MRQRKPLAALLACGALLLGLTACGQPKEAVDAATDLHSITDDSQARITLGMTREEVEEIVPISPWWAEAKGVGESAGDYFGENPEEEIYVSFADGVSRGLNVSAESENPTGAQWHERSHWSLMGIRLGDSREAVEKALGEASKQLHEMDGSDYLVYYYSGQDQHQETPDGDTALAVMVRMKEDTTVGFGTYQYYDGFL